MDRISTPFGFASTACHETRHDMRLSFPSSSLVAGASLLVGTLLAGIVHAAESLDARSLTEQVFETMIQLPGSNPHYRAAHAKGIVCEGTFTASKEAPSLSRAAHLQGGSIPVTVRFSTASPDPFVADNAPVVRGMAIRFHLPDGGQTDIVMLSHNGFAVGTGEDFLAFQKALVATDRSKPHPWPIEVFAASHPIAAKYMQETRTVPASFAMQAFFSNSAFVFVDRQSTKRAGRYQFLPVEQRYLDDAEAATKPADFLVEELRARLARGPVRFRVLVQLANPGDPTNDASLVWPDDRKTVELGVVSIGSVVVDSDAAQKALVFMPTNLTDGVELSDDPLPPLRTSVYALSFARRQQP
jgi:catalase